MTAENADSVKSRKAPDTHLDARLGATFTGQPSPEPTELIDVTPLVVEGPQEAERLPDAIVVGKDGVKRRVPRTSLREVYKPEPGGAKRLQDSDVFDAILPGFRFIREREVDSRRRLSLAGAGNPAHTRYRVSVQPDGDILLQPVVSVLAHEAVEAR